MNFNNQFLDRVGRILDGRKLVVVDYWYLTLCHKKNIFLRDFKILKTIVPVTADLI